MKTIKFYTLGCKVNQYDTQSIRERFLRRGFKEILSSAKAGVCLINTCTVTQGADQKSRNIIRRSSRENPGAKIIVTGCLVNKDHAAIAAIKGVGLVIDKKFFPDGISGFSGRTRAFLKIQDGCDNFCAYCKVPLVRGRSRSRSLCDVVGEARALAKKGYKEIVLTGICLGAYGRDLRPKTNLVKLIGELEKIGGLLRIRLSSIEAGDVSGELIEKLAGAPKLCRHLHIPIQSGDDLILKKMRRKYTRKYYLNLINLLRRKIPDIAITTDVIVGFPGEREKNFKNTLELVKRINPLKVHVFPYSSREGVLACGCATELSTSVINKRKERLVRLADSLADGFRRRFLRRNMPVLFETRVKNKPGFWEGYSDNYIKVRIKSGRGLKNKLVPVILLDKSLTL
ncbi:MAG: MiaB/RimO family radical SAM methylthiotransferase [Candidatus Omnitrophica bacterium]|nr:MiaB/RimO family radical SAM methylthiotransferase [Candidatus Omnitrophota bacterium]